MPFACTTLGSEQRLIASELLGQRRDPLAPIKDAVTADGDVVVPIDVENFGLWLKAAYGRDAADVPLIHSFGPHALLKFQVWTDEVVETMML